MTLQEITQRITDAQSFVNKDPNRAVALNRELFLALTKGDSLYIVPKEQVSLEQLERKQFPPYMGPVQGDDPRHFIRIFSHVETAQSFAEQVQVNQFVAISGTELLQMAKFYFLRGVHGFLLNDGFAWAIISCSDFLSFCLNDIFEDDSFVDPAYVACIQTILAAKANDGVLSLVRGKQGGGKLSSTILILDKQQLESMDIQHYQVSALNMDALLSALNEPNDVCFQLQAAKMDAQFTADDLRNGLCELGIVPENKAFAEELNFHVSSLALRFEPQELAVEEQAAVPAAAQEPPPVTQVSSQEKKPSFFASLKTRLQAVLAGKTAKAEAAATGELAVSQGAPPPAVQEKRPMPRFVSALVFVGVFIVVAGLILLFFLRPTRIDVVKKDIESSNYSDLLADYEKCVKRTPGSADILIPLMIEDIQQWLGVYAADECSAGELGSVIETYRQIPEMADAAVAAYSEASILESSKIAYRNGLAANTVVGRLQYWRGVIATDTGSKEAMAANLAENEVAYKTEVLLDAESMTIPRALSSVMLLKVYYPDDAALDAKIKTLTAAMSEGQQGNTMYQNPDWMSSDVPGAVVDSSITIQRLQVVPYDVQGRVDLYIDWTNHSGKEISNVVFEVVPYDYSGNVVKTSVDVGTGFYSKYMATDLGPFAVGYVTPSGHVWQAAWYSSAISKVEILSVYIEYSDGTSESIASVDTLEALFQTY